MRDPLNRESAKMIFRLFDASFKQGVIDACQIQDDIAAREFVDKHKEAFTYGVLGDDEDYDWMMYRFVLYRWARMYHLKSLAEGYILFIKKNMYLSTLLPFCMQFYIMGIEEWLAYPNPSRLELFRNSKKIHWDLNFPFKNFTTADYVSYLHEFAFAYRKLPEEERIVNPNTMDGYCQALFNLTRKYVAEKNDIPYDP